MAFNGVKSYYDILGVSCSADNAEIKSAYRKLARKYHPDVNKSPEAIDLFKEITIAYETLSDESKRHQYDILNGIFKTTSQQSEYTEQTQSSKHGKQDTASCDAQDIRKTKYNDENKSAKADNQKNKKRISPLMAFRYWCAKFKKNRKERNNKKPQKGQDITTDITISPDEVMTGSQRILNIRTTVTCEKCYGHKFTNGDKCSACGGKGVITEIKKIKLTIPKGVKDGAKLRLKGAGASGKNGGPNGDVYVKIRVEIKTQVHFDKLNIYYNVPITPFEAALGEEITIPAFDGTIKLKLPKNTTSGQKFRLAKQGLKKNGKIGDLIVTVTIEIPQDLSDDEIKLYEQLKNIASVNVRKNFGYGS
mgnify:CR=1 FL=1